MFWQLSFFLLFVSLDISIDGQIMETISIVVALAECRDSTNITDPGLNNVGPLFVACLVSKEVGLNRTEAQALVDQANQLGHMHVNASLALIQTEVGASNRSCITPIALHNLRFQSMSSGELEEEVNACFDGQLSEEQLSVIGQGLVNDRNMFNLDMISVVFKYGSSKPGE